MNPVRPLTIGLDVRAATRAPCGIGRYSVELARGLLAVDPELRLLLYAASRAGGPRGERLPPDLRSHPRVTLFDRRLPAKLVHLLTYFPGFGLDRLTGPFDLFHHTDLVFLRGIRQPEVVTVHDLAFEVSRAFHEPGFHRTVRARMERAIGRARAVIVPSACTKKDLVDRWRCDAARIHVVPLGADHVLRRTASAPRDPRDPARPPRPWFLHVGTLEPRKNLPRLVRAFRRACERGLDADLVLVGPDGWLRDELDAELARTDSRWRARILLRGAVDEAELRGWLEGALALVYPSLYEGFGLPVAEAMALGVPVITSARSATAEVAGDAALLVDPEDEEGWSEALLRTSREVPWRRAMAERGRTRGARFTWAATAGATLAVYRAATGS